MSGRRFGAAACRTLLPFALLFGFAGECLPAEALKGVALSIGQADYEALSDLQNTERDANSVEEIFDKLGFEATATTDRDGRRLARDLDGFLDDAEGADVAVLYYAGHAVEIGGENFLVPTDADSSSPEALAEKLVPLSDYVRKLQTTVPVAIVLLDACRDNPFPLGTTVRLAPGAEPASVGAQGLQARGVVALKALAAGTEDLGIVVAFAAEPGKVALDGEPGGNSPYAAALLRHLTAMSGEEFGTVMRMVAEEVYLKTGGRQRPWMNESLRRLLFFGEAPADPDGDDGDILRERRQLLLTIADLPDFDRRQVERVAANGGVPMDAIYGMLKALGKEVPRDPAKLEELLRKQAEELKTFLAERRAVENPDPELTRLSALAEKAVSEGALATARQLREQSDRRIVELSKVLGRAEEGIRARRIEFAAEYARSAEISVLAFDHIAAAGYYRQAFEQVEAWDEQLAWTYKRLQAAALVARGDFAGDKDALVRSIVATEEMSRLARRLDDPAKVASSELNLGIALLVLGQREAATPRLQEAAEAFRRALEFSSRETDTLPRARARTNLAAALTSIAKREPTRERLLEAVEANRAALSAWSLEGYPVEWVAAQLNLAQALFSLSEREAGTERADEAAAAFRLIIERVSQQSDPLKWTLAHVGLANTQYLLGYRGSGTAQLESAAATHRAVLDVLPRDRVPLLWAMTQDNLGMALATLGERTSAAAYLREAVAAHRAALVEFERERSWNDWMRTTSNLGSALSSLGELEKDINVLKEALAVEMSLLSNLDKKQMPALWARQANNAGYDSTLIARLGGPVEYADDAVTLLREVVRIQEENRDYPAVGFSRGSLCSALVEVGRARRDSSLVSEAISECRQALEIKRRFGLGAQSDDSAADLAYAEATLKQLDSP